MSTAIGEHGVRRAAWSMVLLTAALLSLATLTSRLPFVAHSTALDQDAAHFALALDHFDLLHKQPQAPGYVLFLAPAALLHQVGLPPTTALVWTSIAFSIVGVLATWRLGRALFGPAAGLAAALLLSSSPLFWSRGEMALSYTAEAACQALVGWALWRALERRLGSTACSSVAALGFASVALGVAAGVRQDLLLFLGPLWLWVALHLDLRQRPRGIALAAALAAAAALIWAAPLVTLSGGPGRYLEAAQLEADLLRPQMGLASLPNLRLNLRTVLVGLAWLGGAGWLLAAAYLLLHRRALGSARTGIRPRDPRGAFLAVWLAPALLFFSLANVKLDYLLSLGPALAVLLGAALVRLVAENRRRLGLLVGVLLGNSLLFVLWPAGSQDWLGRRDIIAVDQVDAAYTAELASRFDPHAALLITPAGSTPGFRAAMLAYPAYTVYRLDLEAPAPAEHIVARDRLSTYPLPSGGAVITVEPAVQVLVWLSDDPPPAGSEALPAQAHTQGRDIAYFWLPFPSTQPSVRLGAYEFVRSAP